MLSEQKKFIFIHIPKTGGNAITVALRKFSEDEFRFSRRETYDSIGMYNRKHPISKHDMLKMYQKCGYDLDKYFKFTIVRNPWDRISSWLHYEIKKGKGINTMDELLEHLTGLRDEKTGMYSQSDYLKTLTGDMAIDYIIRFENLQEGFNDVCDKLDIERIKLEKINTSQNSNIDYRDMFNKRQRDLVYDVHKEDIKKFGYKF